MPPPYPVLRQLSKILAKKLQANNNKNQVVCQNSCSFIWMKKRQRFKLCICTCTYFQTMLTTDSYLGLDPVLYIQHYQIFDPFFPQSKCNTCGTRGPKQFLLGVFCVLLQYYCFFCNSKLLHTQPGGTSYRQVQCYICLNDLQEEGSL